MGGQATGLASAAGGGTFSSRLWDAVPVDSIASVKSQGIIGDKFIQLSLGGDETVFKDGETITDTESAVDLESLISKFAFGKVK